MVFSQSLQRHEFLTTYCSQEVVGLQMHRLHLVGCLGFIISERKKFRSLRRTRSIEIFPNISERCTGGNIGMISVSSGVVFFRSSKVVVYVQFKLNLSRHRIDFFSLV
jgi:hypothetical protein